MSPNLAYYCAELLNRLDDVLDSSRIGLDGERPVLALNKSAGLTGADNILLKNRAINALRECFISTDVFAINKNHLLLFIANEGFELLTMFESKTRLCFYLRTPSFDIVVEHTR